MYALLFIWIKLSLQIFTFRQLCCSTRLLRKERSYEYITMFYILAKIQARCMMFWKQILVHEHLRIGHSIGKQLHYFKGNCSPSQHVILSAIAVLYFGMEETLIRRFHGPTSSIARDKGFKHGLVEFPQPHLEANSWAYAISRHLW